MVDSGQAHLSVVQHGIYTVEPDALERDNILSRAKRPGDYGAFKYQEVETAASRFLRDRNRAEFNGRKAQLEDQMQRAETAMADDTAHDRIRAAAEAQYWNSTQSVDAMRRFETMFGRTVDGVPRLADLAFSKRGRTEALMLGGLRIPRPFTLRVVGRVGGRVMKGALVFTFSETVPTNRRVEAAEYTAAVIYEALVREPGNLHDDISPTLCLVLDVFEQRPVPVNVAQLRTHRRLIRAAGYEACANWPHVA